MVDKTEQIRHRNMLKRCAETLYDYNVLSKHSYDTIINGIDIIVNQP